MDMLGNARIKWPYVTHLVDRSRVTGLLPAVSERSPGSLLLARVVQIGRHKDLEAHSGRRMALYAGDVFVAALGDRYATDQYEGAAICSGTTGHIVGIGGVCGEVVSKNNRMSDPTVIEWIGRLQGPDGRALNLRDFRIPAAAPIVPGPRPRVILSLGASMNAGKTTTAAQTVRSLAASGRRVAAAKITGTACRKDPNILEDAGASRVLDFTWCGHASTANFDRATLTSIALDLERTLAAEGPDDIVFEIADGIVQRETRMLLEDPAFRARVDAVTFAGPDSLSCESGVRLLRSLGYRVVSCAGIVANSRLGIAEVEAATGLPCLSGEMILGGALVGLLANATTMSASSATAA